MGSGLLALKRALMDEGFILNVQDVKTLRLIQEEKERIRAAMDAGGNDPKDKPPMFWTGIPFPKRIRSGQLNSHGRHLIISVGGTNVSSLVMELRAGRVIAYKDGKAFKGEEIKSLEQEQRMPTPPGGGEAGHAPGRAGMIEPIVKMIYPQLTHPKNGCRSIILNWAFPHLIERKDGIGLFDFSAVITSMTKEQRVFSDLVGQRVEEIFKEALRQGLIGEIDGLKGGGRRRYLKDLLADLLNERRLKITVANDTVMAIQYFLIGENLERYDQIGLFVLGTGANFTIAENYSFKDGRPLRQISQPLAEKEGLERYFVNYEIGSLELKGTKTIYDSETDYQIERDALAGRAFGKKFKELVCRKLSPKIYEAISTKMRGETAIAMNGELPELEAPEVVGLSSYSSSAVKGRLSNLGRSLKERLGLIADAIIERSALHAALVLAATTERTGFGLKEPHEREIFGLNKNKHDALCLEGSLWKIAGYRERVYDLWKKLSGRELQLDFLHEPSYNASLYGPIYLVALHPERVAKMLS